MPLIFLAIFTFCSLGIHAQSLQSSDDTKPAIDKHLGDIVRARRAPLVLLKPSDLVGISPEVLQNRVSGDPCETAEIIQVNTVVNGFINQSDCHLPDDSYADFYVFNGQAGQVVPIYLSSDDVDTYLGIANETGSYSVEDDDGGAGTNSYILATLPETGLYVILVNTAFANEFGTYTLSLSPTPYCAYSVNPTSATVPGAGGIFNINVETQFGCGWQAYTQESFISVTSPGQNGPGSATYSVTPNGPDPRSGIISIVPGFSPVPVLIIPFTVNQEGLNCSYSISPTSINLPVAQHLGTFSVIAPAGCFWSANSTEWWISTNSEGRGNGTVTYLVAANNAAERTGTIHVGGQTFTITQSGQSCTYTVSPMNIVVDRVAQDGLITVNTQPGCTWNIYRETWVSVNKAGIGPGTATFHVFANPTNSNRTDTITFNVVGAPGSTTLQITQTASTNRVPVFDFDGDGKTDVSIFRPGVGEWWYLRSIDGANGALQFGAETDLPTPADFTGDGKTDIAFWRPSNGFWYILRSEDNSFYSFPFGATGDKPVPADYDGDGTADVAVFRESTQNWYILKSAGGGTSISTFGAPGDKPVVADYDGDRRADIAIYRPSNGEWWYAKSSSPNTIALQFGTPGDRPVPGDYTGDGKADVAYYRPSSGEWFILRSEDGSFYSVPFGTTGDLPAPGDYDGDGKYDTTVFRPSSATWFSNRSTAGTMIVTFGITGDQPVPGAFVP